MKMTSSTDLEFAGLPCALRHGEVKDLPDDPEATAFIVAQEVPEPASKTTRQ